MTHQAKRLNSRRLVLVSFLVIVLAGSALLSDLADIRAETSFTAARSGDSALPQDDYHPINLSPWWYNQNYRLTVYGTTLKSPLQLLNKTRDHTRHALLTWQRDVFPGYRKMVHIIHSLSLAAHGVIWIYLDIPPPFFASPSR